MTDHSITDIDVPVPVAEQVMNIRSIQPSRAVYNMFLTTAFVYQRLSYILYQAAIAIPGGLAALGRHWARYYPRLAFGEQGVILPASTLTFMINTLLAFIEIKSQGQDGFPSHPRPLPVTCLIVYGLASAAELVFFAGGLDATSVYVIIARFGRICCLCVLVASLLSVFYF